MGINRTAAIWGFAEATLFFIVPDVFLSIVARNNLRKGLIACLYSLTGALLGGMILFCWGASNIKAANATIEIIPAINVDMLSRVQTALSEQGMTAILFGPVSGTPYKTYAINTAHSGISFGLFILISIPARLIRFTLVTILSHYLARLLRKINIKPLPIIISLWVLFYSFYFYLMPS